MSGLSSEPSDIRTRLLGWYRIFSLVFGILLVIYAGARIGMLRAAHHEQAGRGFLTLRAGARTAMAAFEARDDDYFSTTLRELARVTEDLQLLAVRERGQKVYYFYARSASVFVTPPEPTADMMSVPEYRSPPLTTLRLESSFEQTGTGRTISVEALFQILTPEDLHRVGREAVYALLVFLIVTATILIVSAGRPGRVAGAVPRTATPAPEPRARFAPAEPPRSTVAPLQSPAAPAEAPPVAARPPSPAPEPPRSAPPAEPRPAAPATPPAASPPPAPAPSEGLPRRATIYREDSGLVYRDYLESRLRSEIERAAASDQDVVLAIIALDDAASLANVDAVNAAIAQRLRDSFPYRDLAFEYDRGFAVIIPDINLDKAILRLEDFRQAVAAAPVEGQPVTVSVGIGARNGRLIGDETLLKEAAQSLAKAIRDGRNQVVAFRADPDKFRRVLAN